MRTIGFAFWFPLMALAGTDTLHVVWDADPCNSLTLQWLVHEDEAVAKSIPYGSKPEHLDQVAAIAVGEIASEDDWQLARVSLRNLPEDAPTYFQLKNDGPVLFSETMPREEPDTFRFAEGGDAGRSGATPAICRQAAAFDPGFAVLGGDLAYANGRQFSSWVKFLQEWRANMVAPDGRIIPMVVAIGNHEVKGSRGKDRKHAPFFFSLFDSQFPAQGYRTLDVGNFLSFLLLDSDHTSRVDEKQLSWLRKSVEERAAQQERRHIFPVYHTPAYPGHRSFDGLDRAKIRDLWCPVFEGCSTIGVAFEHDDHVYKRTVPILKNKEAARGVVYVGDGAWGRPTRSVHPVDETWYLERATSVNHVLLVTLTEDSQQIRAVDVDGKTVDQFGLTWSENQWILE